MKKLKVFLIVLLILAIAVTALYFWQRENIKSVYYSAKYDDEKLDELIEEHNREVETFLKEQTDLNVRPSTPVEEKLHQAGVISDEELISILTGKTDLKTLLGTDVTLDDKKKMVDESGNPVNVEKLKEYKNEQQLQAEAKTNGKPNNQSDISGTPPVDNNKPNAETKPGDKPASGSAKEPASGEDKKGNAPDKSGTDSGQSGGTDANVQNGSQTSNGNEGGNVTDPSSCIAEMYALKSSYSAAVDGIISSALSSYSQMTADGGKVDKSQLMEYYNAAVGLEQQCDAAVSQVVGRLRESLEATGGDMSIIDRILSAYASEKSLKKAQYINKIK